MKQNAFLLRELVKRDFQSRYAGSLLGLLWSFVQPLWMLALFTFVFSGVLRISLLGERTGSFAVFLFCGLLPWTAIHEGLTRSSTAITDNSNLVKKLSFPSEILVQAIVLSGLVHQAIATSVFIVVLVVIGELRVGGLPILLVAVVLQVALTFGLGLLAATAHVFFRDTAQALGLLTTGWFYLTPIVYPLGNVPERYRPWVELNPLTALVGMYRQALLGGEVAWVAGMGSLAVFAAAVLLLGWWLFRRLKPTFVDEI